MQRLPSVDVLRIVVVTLVIVRHTWESDSFLISAGSPFFFFMTGWLWRERSRDLRGELSTRWASLGRPYVAWFVIIWLVYVTVSALRGRFETASLLRVFLGGEHAGRPFSTFWFISALLIVAMVLRLLDRLRPGSLAIIAVTVLLVGSAAGPVLAHVPFAAGTALSCVAFALAGRLLRGVSRSLGRRAVVPASAAVGVLTAAASMWRPGLFDLKRGEFGTPLLSAALAVAITWLAIIVLDRLFEALPRVARALGGLSSTLARPSIVVVLVHPVVLFLLDVPAFGADAWVFLVAVLLPWGLAVILERTRFSPWLVGAPQLRRSAPVLQAAR